MGAGEVFQALGGGIAGLLGVAVLALWAMLLYQLNARLKERDARIEELKQDLKDVRLLLKEQTQANNRIAEVAESWMPEQQLKRIKR